MSIVKSSLSRACRQLFHQGGRNSFHQSSVSVFQHSTMNGDRQDKKVIIVGAGMCRASMSDCRKPCLISPRASGIFGVSTALWMYKRGGYSITILDKSHVVPAPDAASTDINKVIRSGDYADPAIAALNVDAVNEWRRPEWEGTYHE
jgi:hypothetical protein